LSPESRSVANERCILLLGGSFDPVHNGHIGLARYFCTLLHPDELRLIPAGRPWQKPAMIAAPLHRIAMLELAFANWVIPVHIDTQEIERDGPSYAIDTLHTVRQAVGDQVSLVWVIGADQLINLHTWHQWQSLFSLTNFCIAARPGYELNREDLNDEVAAEISRRQASPGQLRASPAGLCFIATHLALDVSSSALRAALSSNPAGQAPQGLLPAPVLDYAQQHYLYQTT
jgi:nicotinate-nucleotide adenylyltransferase